ncbi:hypothetical protein MTO96_027252 [Rhipicephalus appendiculatus]
MSGGCSTLAPKQRRRRRHFKGDRCTHVESVGSWRAQDVAEANSPERSAVTVVVCPDAALPTVTGLVQ